MSLDQLIFSLWSVAVAWTALALGYVIGRRHAREKADRWWMIGHRLPPDRIRRVF